jgi:hypothetical protein
MRAIRAMRETEIADLNAESEPSLTSGAKALLPDGFNASSGRTGLRLI